MSKRPAALIAFLLLAGAIVAALYWSMSARLQPAPAPEKLTLAVIDTYIGSGLVHIAAAKGYFAAEGLEVTLQPHGSGGPALAALREGKADVTTLGSLPFVFATLNRADLSIVASIASSVRGAGVAARRDRGIAAAADLRGKTVGVTLGTDGHFALGLLLSEHGIPMNQVKTQDIKPEAIVAALSSGQVDAVCTWEPLLSSARTALGATGASIDMDRGFLFWFQLVGRRDFVRAHPATMQKLLRALLRAQRYVAQDRPAAAAIVAAATQMSPERFAALWPNFSLQLNLPQGLLNLLEDQARWAISNGYTPATQVPDFLGALHLESLLAVEPRAVLIVR